VASPSQLNQIVGQFVGPSLVTSDGRLLPANQIEIPAHAYDVHGVPAAHSTHWRGKAGRDKAKATSGTAMGERTMPVLVERMSLDSGALDKEACNYLAFIELDSALLWYGRIKLRA
jgi:hypothetical protein